MSYEALKTLKEDKSIVISKADKGNAVVIQNITDYKAKVRKILDQPGKFKKLKRDVTKTRENSLLATLKELKREDGMVPDKRCKNGMRHEPHRKAEQRMSENVYEHVRPVGSRAGVLYGLPKIHKPDAPIRPIISAVSTYNYKLAKYLDSILKPIFESDEYMVQDTFDFVEKVRDLNVDEHKYIVSFDVESLFTNVPTRETIEIILNRVYTKDVKFFHGLTRDQLDKLLTICTQESHFQFGGDYYDQIDGVSMGSPLGPRLANAFMSDFEKKHMQKLKELGVRHWCRYVDDIFASMNSKDEANTILQYLNEQHPNIKFTIEYERNNKLPFVDTCVKRMPDRYITTVYHKKTFTGVYLNWTSLTSRKYKIGLIKCLLNRILRICSETADRDLEIRKLKFNLESNQYPRDIIEKVIKEELDRVQNKRSTATESQTEPSQTKDFIALPYNNNRCEDFARRLTKTVNENFPSTKFSVAFQSPKTIGDLFPFKDNIAKNEDKALVVYLIKCKDCSASYIGKTQRVLARRLYEHSRGAESACHQHCTSENHTMDYDGVEIIDHASNDTKLKIKELLHILKRKPELNRQMNSQNEFNIKTILIKAYSDYQK